MMSCCISRPSPFEAAAGQRQVVFITGEVGIGKTSLIHAFHEASQTCMAYGHCVEGLSEKEPYYAILEALGHCLTSPDHEQKPAGPARLGSSHDRPGELCEALEDLAREKLFILVIEDVQWAHESTLELLSALARRSTPAKLLVLATYRPQHHSTKFYLKSIKQDLLIRHLCAEIALEPLCKQSIRHLLLAASTSNSCPRNWMTSSISAPAAIRSLQMHCSITSSQSDRSCAPAQQRRPVASSHLPPF